MSKKKIINFLILFLFLSLVFPFVWKLISISIFDKYSGFIKFLNAGSNRKTYFVSFLYTLLFMFLTVVGQLLLGVLTAYLTYFSKYSKKLLLLFFVPYTIPLFVSTITARTGLEENGFITNFINSISSETYLPLTNNLFHFVALVLLSIWQYFPFVFIIIYTMMKRINKTYIETAITDGASNFKLFLNLILPNISNIVYPLLILRLLFMFNKYDITVLFAKSFYTQYTSINLIPIYLSPLFDSLTFPSYAFIIVVHLMVFFILLSYAIKKLWHYSLTKI